MSACLRVDVSKAFGCSRALSHSGERVHRNRLLLLHRTGNYFLLEQSMDQEWPFLPARLFASCVTFIHCKVGGEAGAQAEAD